MVIESGGAASVVHLAMLVAAASCVLLGAFTRGTGRRVESISRDALMLVAMVDTGHGGAGLVLPIVWVTALVGFAMVTAAVGSRRRGHASGSLHTVGLILMAGLVAITMSSGGASSHAGHAAGGSVALGSLAIVATGVFVVITAFIVRREWVDYTSTHSRRGVGGAHHGAMAASMVLMAVAVTS
jgi:hypothetical protein